MSKLLRYPAVKAKIGGLSRTTIWRLEHSGCFPRRRIVTPKIVVWDEAEIDIWIQSRDKGYGYVHPNCNNRKSDLRK